MENYFILKKHAMVNFCEKKKNILQNRRLHTLFNDTLATAGGKQPFRAKEEVKRLN